MKYGFSQEEFEVRLARSQKKMFEHNLDALLLTTRQNINYFSGFSTEFWESPTRPWFLVIPLSGDPIAIVPEIGESEMKKTWLNDIRFWPSPRPEDEGISLLTNILNNLPKRFHTVGAELGREMFLRMPIIDYHSVVDSVNLKIINASPCIWEIRMLKTNEEITKIRHVCKIASHVYKDLPNIVGEGDTEKEVARRIKISLLSQGADSVPFLPVVSEKGGTSQIICGPKDKKLIMGDLLFVDTGSTFDGYFCDFNRNFSVGTPASELAEAQDYLWLATEAGLKAAQPGAKTKDIWRAINSVLASKFNVNGGSGRFGHGLGLELTEPPSICEKCQIHLMENMVITIEPSVEFLPGKILVHEENIVIKEGGAEILTERAPREMQVIN